MSCDSRRFLQQRAVLGICLLHKEIRLNAKCSEPRSPECTPAHNKMWAFQDLFPANLARNPILSGWSRRSRRSENIQGLMVGLSSFPCRSLRVGSAEAEGLPAPQSSGQKSCNPFLQELCTTGRTLNGETLRSAGAFHASLSSKQVCSNQPVLSNILVLMSVFPPQKPFLICYLCNAQSECVSSASQPCLALSIPLTEVRRHHWTGSWLCNRKETKGVAIRPVSSSIMGFGTFCKDRKPPSTAVWQCVLPNLIISYFKQRQVNIHCTPERSGTKDTIAAGVYNTPLRGKTKKHVKIMFEQATQACRDQKRPNIGLFIQSAGCLCSAVQTPSGSSWSSVGFPSRLCSQDPRVLKEHPQMSSCTGDATCPATPTPSRAWSPAWTCRQQAVRAAAAGGAGPGCAAPTAKGYSWAP